VCVCVCVCVCVLSCGLFGSVAGPAEAELASILLECVSTVILKTEYPRTLIEIVVQIVTDDGSVRCVFRLPCAVV